MNSDAETARQAWTTRYLHSVNPCQERILKQVNYGVTFYRKIWESLGLHAWFNLVRRNSSELGGFDSDLTAFFLSAMQILCPMSTNRTFSRRDELLIDFSSLRMEDIYCCLDGLETKKNKIIAHLNKNIEKIYNRTKTTGADDITIFCFEPFESYELKLRRANKARKAQHALGLLIDGEGIPVSYELFWENTSKKNPLLETAAYYTAESSLKKVTAAADREENSGLNRHNLAVTPRKYIVALPIDRLPTQIKDKIFSDEWDEVFVSKDDEETFKVKTIHQRSVPELGSEIIVTWSAWRRAQDLKVLGVQYETSRKLPEPDSVSNEPSIMSEVSKFTSVLRH